MAVRERVTQLNKETVPSPVVLADEPLTERERVLRQMLETEIQKRASFIRALVHELKTPLTAMVASSDLMASGIRQEPWLSLSRNIHKSSTGLNRRIDELLDLARGEIGLLTLKSQLVNPRQLLYQIAEEVAKLALQQHKTLKLEMPPSLPVIQADEMRLRQVIMNLLSNAFKFTLRDGEVILACEESTGCLVFSVTDHGPGISEPVQKRLFEPYQRWDDDVEILSGLRIGLALCKILVELHGGKIRVKSAQGNGSTFSFSLPLNGGLR